MKLTFLGHQTWWITSENTCVVFNPVIEETFGVNPYASFWIFPFRKVKTANLPTPDAIVLTNEHVQQFQPASINHFPRSTPVFISMLAPQFVEHIIRRLGFTVHRVHHEQVHQIKTLKLTFYLPNNDVPLWETNGMSCFCVDTIANQGVYIQSDLSISQSFITQCNVDKSVPLSAIIVTNNSQFSQDIPIAFHGNLLTMDNPHQRLALEVYKDLLVDQLENLPIIPCIIVAGSGYTSRAIGYRPFAWTQPNMVDAIQPLLLNQRLLIPTPGEQIDIRNFTVTTVDWVEKSHGPDFINEDELGFCPVFPPIPENNIVQVIETVLEPHLFDFGKALSLSKLGCELLNTQDYLSGPLDGRRFLLVCGTDNESYGYAYDLAQAKFIREALPSTEPFKTYPFGVAAYLQDWIALFEGKIQIWELANLSLQQWYVTKLYQTPLSFLYEYFSEAVRPYLAEKTYLSKYDLLLSTLAEKG